MIDSDNWYYNQDGIALGPFTAQFMETEFEKGTFPPDTLIWHPDQTHWLPLSECQPPWTQATSRAILQPGPLHMPLPIQSATRSRTPPAIPSDIPPSPRAPIKPIAHSEVPNPSKESFLKRLFGRKS